MSLSRNIFDKLSLFSNETSALIAEVEALILNLFFLHETNPDHESIIVIVGSRLDTFILWLLSICNILPNYRVLSFIVSSDINDFVQSNETSDLCLIVPRSVFIRHYQALSRFRSHHGLIII